MIIKEKAFLAAVRSIDPNKPNNPMGRPPKYDFKNKLKNIGDFVVVSKKDKINARNSMSQLKNKMLANDIPWNYYSESLPNGDVKFVRCTAEGEQVSTLDEQDIFAIEKMPFGIWFCVDGSDTISVLTNRRGKPIFEKIIDEKDRILTKNIQSTDWNYEIKSIGYIYNDGEINQNIRNSAKFLVNWLRDEDSVDDLISHNILPSPQTKSGLL